MRFMLKPKIKRKDGEHRYVKRFALLPIKINNEIRWLEMCYLCQAYWIDWDSHGWMNLAFITKDVFILYNKRNNT